jgi:hypothetical protein
VISHPQDLTVSPITRRPTVNFPIVAPARPSRKMKYRNINIKNAKHNGSVINNPLFHRWSVALITQTPFTILVMGKKNIQNIKKSIIRDKKRVQSPAYFLFLLLIEFLEYDIIYILFSIIVTNNDYTPQFLGIKSNYFIGLINGWA